MLPTFIVIGAAKCGTTSVCDILSGHPDVFVSNPKEPHYFASKSEAQFAERRAWYESLFDAADGFRALGEGSVSCTRPNAVATAARRIRDVIPNCRLIYMVRHPIRRLESDWKMLRHERRVARSIARAIDERPPLVAWGYYWKHLNVYRELFLDDQILVVFLEDFARAPDTQLERICRHIGVEPPPSWPDPERPRNAATGYRAAGALAQWLKQRPQYERAKRWIPKSAMAIGKALLTRRERHRLQWDDATRRFVANAYREDARNLLDFCGKPVDFWDLGN